MLEIVPDPIRNARRRHRALIAAFTVLAVAAVVTLTVLSGRAGFAAPAVPSVPGVGDGFVAEGEWVTLQTAVPAIEKLDPSLRGALAAAAADAGAEAGLDLEIVSGWRSPAYQEYLFDQAVETYASEEIARRFVASPDVSSHVSGEAVDLGPVDMQFWLSGHGADYGLCQTYANEPWHWEQATVPGGTCPEMLPDASAPRF